MKHILFYALKEDILPVMEAVELKCSLKYFRAGQFSELNQQAFTRGCEIPNLGIASSESSISCETFLVTEKPNIDIRPIQQTDGSMRFSVDQLLNPDTVTFTAGGIWRPDVILYGRVATASDSSKSQDLMKLFNSAFRKHFKKVKAYWIGPKAHVLLEEGARLTIAAQSSRDFDLKI
jgi:hypothetical protein